MDVHHRNVKKIAVMGGTFDPIHYGHLVTAEAVRHQYNIDQVLFVPTGHPPHKRNRAITDAQHRYLMSILATETNPHFFVSRIEIDRQGLTYTIDTIKELKEQYRQDTEIYFITGADAFLEIFTWKQAEELLEICNFIAATRPEYPKEDLVASIAQIEKNYRAKFNFIEVPALAISSSEIRNRVSSGEPIKYLLPEAVENYIEKYQLYKG
ncbi:nicotinate-nucleotide adenylyltransferase [Vallitalea okinawensis]|uniref:nicotinate-nucleotide adenylyltransferase n=1 Tax=Vallitalea okinawensis TaxID=2078660 RepID=UPI000CFC2E3E|nr:nicotinate-nucleotide adenylyltransferase [Vallitalea okinawensis]